MSKNDALYPVIRKVEKSEAVDATYQNRIEVRKGTWLGGRTWYLVSHNNSGQASAHGQMIFPVKAHEQDWNLYLRIKYTATTTASGLAQRIAEKVVAVLGGDHPQAVLEQRIGSLAGEFLAKNGGSAVFIEHFEKQKAQMAAYIKMRIEDTAGLSLALTLTPTTGGQPFEKSRKTDPDIRFKLQDYPGTLTAKLSFDLDPQFDSEGRISVWAYIHQGALDQLVQDALAGAEHFLKNLYLHQLEFEIGEVRKNLRDLLERLAGARGRTVGRFSLECQLPIPPGIQPMERITIESISFKNLLEYPQDVIAKCELQLELMKLGVYIEQKQPVLREWAEKTLRAALLTKLLNVPYIDLFLGSGKNGMGGFQVFDQKKTDTEEEVRLQAEAIGYRVTSISIRTNLQFEELRRGFLIEIKDEEYETSVQGYPAGLDVEVSARITDEDVIRNLFRQDVDIKKIIRRAIHEEIRKELRKISPEKYYTHFEGSDETASATVLDRLSQIIRDLLERDCKATEISAVCRQRLTDLAELFNNLRKEQRKIVLLDEKSGLHFDVVFRVNALRREHWEEFQVRRPSVDAVQETVEYCIKQRLASEGRNKLLQAPDIILKEGLTDLVGQRDVPAELGVTVKIVYFARRLTGGQKAFLEQLDRGIIDRIESDNKLQDMDKERNEASLEELQRQLMIAYKSGDLGEIERINKHIQDIKASWSQTQDDGSSLHRIPGIIDEAARKEISSLGALTGGHQGIPSLSQPKGGRKARALLNSGRKPNKSPE